MSVIFSIWKLNIYNIIVWIIFIIYFLIYKNIYQTRQYTYSAPFSLLDLRKIILIE